MTLFITDKLFMYMTYRMGLSTLAATAWPKTGLIVVHPEGYLLRYDIVDGGIGEWVSLRYEH